MAKIRENLTAAKAFMTKRTVDATSGVIAALSSADTAYIELTSATTLQGIANGIDAKELVVSNQTGVPLTLSNESAGASAANRVVTGLAADYQVPAGVSLLLKYSTTNFRWNVVNGTMLPSGSNQIMDAVTSDVTIPVGNTLIQPIADIQTGVNITVNGSLFSRIIKGSGSISGSGNIYVL